MVMDKKTLIDRVFSPIRDAGFAVWFVGGCVRDYLMGVTPHDYDICTTATPSDLHKIFSDFSNVSENAEPYGVTIILVDKTEVEIATLRKDLTKGRHPKIEFTTSIYEDAARRDFTVNALYENYKGEIFDPTGSGFSDCENKFLRFVGNPQERIDEDPLRALRFVRFISSKGFNSAYSLRDVVNWKTDFSEVSKERILKELEKTFSGNLFPNAWLYFLAMKIPSEIGLAEILNEMVKTTQSLKWHAEGSTWKNKETGEEIFGDFVKDFSKFTPVKNGNVMAHTILVMKGMQEEMKNEPDEHKRFLMMMSALLHDIGKTKPTGTKSNVWDHFGEEIKEEIPDVHEHDVVGAPMAYEFCKKLGMSNDDSEFVSELTRLHMRMHQLTEIKSRFKMLKLTNHKFFNDVVVLARADEAACVKTVNDEWIGVDKALTVPLASECVGVPMPQPLVTGKDLIDIGRTPGPIFSKLLNKAMEFQIDKKWDKEEILKHLKNMWK